MSDEEASRRELAKASAQSLEHQRGMPRNLGCCRVVPHLNRAAIPVESQAHQPTREKGPHGIGHRRSDADLPEP